MSVTSVVDLTSRQKAAIVVMSLGSGAQDLLKGLGHGEAELLAEEILQLGSVPEDVRDQVLAEFSNRLAATQPKTASALETAAELLEATLGKAEAGEVVKRIEWRANQNLHNFGRRDPARFGGMIENEHPQAIAFLLTQLDPDTSGRVMVSLPEELQPEIAWRIATMAEIPPETAAAVHQALEPRVRPEGADSRRVERPGGEEKVADLLNMISVGAQESVLDTLSSKDADMAARVRKLMFVFRDIMLLDDRSLQRVLKEVDLKDLSLALKTAADDIKQTIFKNVSERAALTIQEEMEYMGPVKPKEVEEAQDRIIERVRTLVEQGEIVINRGGATDAAV